MLSALISLFFLLLFSEFAAANFKRLAPILEAWDQTKKNPVSNTIDLSIPWQGGWEKVAVLFWTLGNSIPLLAFSLACKAFIQEPNTASNLIVGSIIGTNVVALSLAFGLVLLAGPLTFFRVRTITSPVFLLLGTVAFTYACLNNHISRIEGLILLALSVGYGFYFGRFSSEWKYYERKQANSSLLESSEGFLPILAVFCLGIGFSVLAVITAYPFVTWLYEYISGGLISDAKIAVHVVAFALALPWLVRSLVSLRASATGKALTITSLAHACMLNVLFLPGLLGLLWTPDLSPHLLAIDIPVLLVYTGIFVAALLIEKESGGLLTVVLILSYLLYTGLGVFL